MKKFGKLLKIIFNTGIVVATGAGLFLAINNDVNKLGVLLKEVPLEFVKYFIYFGSVFLLIYGLIGVIQAIIELSSGEERINKGLYVYKLAATVAGLGIFLSEICYLRWKQQPTHIGGEICLYYIAPLLTAFTFLFFDNRKKIGFGYCFLGMLIPLIFTAYAVPCYTFVDGWKNDAYYQFMNFLANPLSKDLIVIAIIVGGSLVLSILFWLLNRITFLIFVGEERSSEITNEEKIAYEKKIKVTKEELEEIKSLEKETLPKTKTEKKPKKAKSVEEEYIQEVPFETVRVYHISLNRENKMWQVKLANGKRAIKFFPTQAEAIYFAKKLVETMGGSIRVHSVKGRLRKA